MTQIDTHSDYYHTVLHEQTLDAVRKRLPRATFARIVCGLHGDYVLAFDGLWHYGDARQSPENAVAAFVREGAVRTTPTLPQAWAR